MRAFIGLVMEHPVVSLLALIVGVFVAWLLLKLILIMVRYVACAVMILAALCLLAYAVCCVVRKK